ncbi:MAG: late competence development ComFB family protein [Clostridiales bacterium]|nr:late competence development ComFB family protein [Clostridiales bacterium]
MADNEKAAVSRQRPEHFQLVNAYDEIVYTTVREVMAKTNMCQCERCYLDICAIVFNQGYTHFVNTREGRLLKKIPHMNTGTNVEMMVQVMHAMKLVRDFPHHRPDGGDTEEEAEGDDEA